MRAFSGFRKTGAASGVYAVPPGGRPRNRRDRVAGVERPVPEPRVGKEPGLCPVLEAEHCVEGYTMSNAEGLASGLAEGGLVSEVGIPTGS